MSDSNYKPSGELQGDDRAMPDRGTSTGMVGMGAPYGASIDANAINRMGDAHTAPDPMDQVMPPGDAGLRFTSAGHSSPDYGKSMGSAAQSDAPGEDEPSDPRSNAKPEGADAEDRDEY